MDERKSAELLVIVSSKRWACASCAAQSERGDLLTMDDAGPLCMDCATLGTWSSCPAATPRSTRRAKRGSRLSAVVVQWSRARHRYERHGILAEEDAIAAAERARPADSDARARRRERDAERRVAEDQHLVADFAAAIRLQFPGCSAERAERIARHAGTRSSGRIGRTSAGRAMSPDAVKLAVIASVRHEDTGYEELLMQGVGRAEARDLVRPDIDPGAPRLGQFTLVRNYENDCVGSGNPCPRGGGTARTRVAELRAEGLRGDTDLELLTTSLPDAAVRWGDDGNLHRFGTPENGQHVAGPHQSGLAQRTRAG